MHLSLRDKFILNMDIFIYAYSYNENSGGVIALHRLCHLINEVTNHQAYLVPHRKYGLRQDVKYIFKKPKLDVHTEWNTPIWRKKTFPKNSIVVYPEIVKGNPLNIKNVVRWLLHNPGNFTGEIDYGDGELYYRYSSGFSYDVAYQSKLSNLFLNVKYTPFDIYYEDTEVQRDIEICYLVRKGVNKVFVHPVDSFCIDDKSHKEIAEIFRRSKRFISYDSYTAYSHFAVLCGCESIVVPEEGISIEQWYPDISDRYGLSYGFGQEQMDWAYMTRKNLAERLIAADAMSTESVKNCLDEIFNYFS